MTRSHTSIGDRQRAEAGLPPDGSAVDPDEEMIRVKVSLCGCDDTTDIEFEVTEDELELLRRLAAASEKASTYRCEPVMEVELESGAGA